MLSRVAESIYWMSRYVERAENVARFGQIESDKIIEAAKLAGVHEMILRLPQGYDTRVGFEDILTLPDGKPASSNGELVAEASRRMNS